MRVKELKQLLELCNDEDIVNLTLDGEDLDAELDDVARGTGTLKGLTYLAFKSEQE